MNFRSVRDLNETILANLHRLPRDIDAVVGIARSGMLPATLISLALNVPLAESTTFVSGTLLGSGSTRQVAPMGRSFDDVRHALIVDDSISTGGSIAKARALLAPLSDRIKLTFCAIYGAADSCGADLILEMVAYPRIFEWNIFHHGVIEQACVDIDGVLCHDPSADENDDGPRYLEFLRHARHRIIPTRVIGELVTSRLERYRAETEQWLSNQGIRYNRLTMLNVATAEERRRLNLHGSFKGQRFRESSATLFIESEHGQAEQIARISGKPVYSIEGGAMCYPDVLSVTGLFYHAKQVRHIRWVWRLRQKARLLLGRG